MAKKQKLTNDQIADAIMDCSDSDEVKDLLPSVRLGTGATADRVYKRLKPIYQKWIDDEIGFESFETLLKQSPTSNGEPSKYTRLSLDEITVEELFKYIRMFVAPILKTDGINEYKVVDSIEKRLEIVSLKNEAAKRAIAQAAFSQDYYLLPTQINQLYANWGLYQKAINKPVSFANYDDDDVWCFEKAPLKPKEGSLGPWLRVLKRVPKFVRDDMLAWLWGVYSGQYKGRRVLYLYGEIGGEGKTYIADLWGRFLFKSAYAATREEDMNSRFALSDFVGKRFVVWQDINYPKVLYKEQVRHLSQGEDGGLTKVESKGQQAKNEILDCRLCLTSNTKPHITNSGATKGRLLLVPFNIPNEADQQQRKDLVDHLPQLLWFGKQLFDSKVDRTGEITLTPESLKVLDDLVNTSDKEFDEWLHENFVLDVNGRLEAEDFKDAIKTTFRSNSADQFKALRSEIDLWIKTKYGVVYISKDSEDSKKPFYKGLRTRDASDNNEQTEIDF